MVKLLLLPLLMLGLVKLCRMDGTRGVALLALCSCPVAQVGWRLGAACSTAASHAVAAKLPPDRATCVAVHLAASRR